MGYPPHPSARGHGEVEMLEKCGTDNYTDWKGEAQQGYMEAELDWGDGTVDAQAYSGFGEAPALHTYAYNGSYKVEIICGHWPHKRVLISGANVNNAAEKPQPASSPFADWKGIAAMVTAIVGVLSFITGRKTAKAPSHESDD